MILSDSELVFPAVADALPFITMLSPAAMDLSAIINCFELDLVFIAFIYFSTYRELFRG